MEKIGSVRPCTESEVRIIERMGEYRTKSEKLATENAELQDRINYLVKNCSLQENFRDCKFWDNVGNWGKNNNAINQ